jgi:1-acyl-sn-glycerol-3-phosphate acyltransferase
MDSLMKVELFCAIEKQLGARIPDEIAYEIRSLADVAKFLKESKAGKLDVGAVKEEDVRCFIKDNLLLKTTRTVTYFLLKGLIKCMFRLRARGLEHVPQQGSFIIGSNHASILDFPLIFCSLPYKITRDVIAPAAQDFFYTKPIRRILVEIGFNTFPFERMGNFMRGLKICAQLIKDGKSIILFPEGSRSKQGVMGVFKPGIGSLAFDLDIPVIPCHIEGAFKAMPKGKVMPRPGRIIVVFGQPLRMDAYKGMEKTLSRYEIYERIAADLRAAIEKLGTFLEHG